MFTKLTIISGGQTGVDRAALEFAVENDIECDGYCPRGRKAEDGVIPSMFPLKELESDDYAARTETNVKYADGTLIITWKNDPGKGTKTTIEYCKKHYKPYYVCNIEDLSEFSKYCNLQEWIIRNRIKKLNIAGNRESEDPGIQSKTKEILSLLNSL